MTLTPHQTVTELQVLSIAHRRINYALEHDYVYALSQSSPTDIDAISHSIFSKIEAEFGKTREDIRGLSRKREVVVARQVAYYLLAKVAKLGWSEAGRLCNRDHSSVIHGVESLESLLTLKYDMWAIRIRNFLQK